MYQRQRLDDCMTPPSWTGPGRTCPSSVHEEHGSAARSPQAPPGHEESTVLSSSEATITVCPAIPAPRQKISGFVFGFGFGFMLFGLWHAHQSKETNRAWTSDTHTARHGQHTHCYPSVLSHGADASPSSSGKISATVLLIDLRHPMAFQKCPQFLPLYLQTQSLTS